MITILKYLLIITLLVLLIFIFLSKKYQNPYKLIMIFGKKGSGKTTFLTKMSLKYNKLGYKVFSNCEIYGAYKLDVDDIGKKDFPFNSVLLIDEVSLIWSNRDFAKFKKSVEQYFRYQRQYKHIVYLSSQSFDIDKKIRDLCDSMYLLTNIGGFLTVAKSIVKVPCIHSPKYDEDTNQRSSEGFITEDFKYGMIWDWIFTFNPRYFPYFNSYNPPYHDIAADRVKYRFENEVVLHRLRSTRDYLVYTIKNLAAKIIKNIKTPVFVQPWNMFFLDI